jgi:metal-responsive CopG/Arc/MetJ family transcriptional regulator
MPGKRRAGQVFIGLQADAELIRDLDRARGRTDRSQFVREAIADKLKKMGIAVPDDLVYPPARARVIPFVGDNSRAAVSQTAMAAEEPGRYGTRKRKKKR